MVLKKCTECGESKNHRLFYQTKTKGGGNGRKSVCKECQLLYEQSKKPLEPLETRLGDKTLFSEEVDTISKLTQWELDGYQSTWVDMTLDRVVKYFLDTQCKLEDSCVVKSGRGSKNGNRKTVDGSGEGGNESGNGDGESGGERITFTDTPSWIQFWTSIQQKEEYQTLSEFLVKERDTYVPDLDLFPPPAQVFHSFIITPFHKVRVVILGQDPYHGPRQAHGLAFSVSSGIKIPPSLKNIFRELSSDVGVVVPDSGDLTSWGHQGVLLLNTALTVRQSCPNSHAKYWGGITNHIISYLSTNSLNPLVFILWGAHAKSKKVFIDDRHHIIESNHPSPLSANRGGFFETKPFSRCNEWLKAQGKGRINWETVR